MMNVNLYRFNTELKIVELGSCDTRKLNEILQESIVNSNQIYESGEEAIVKTSFGLSKTAEDFIEIHCQRNSEISVYSDRLVFDSVFKKIFSTKIHFNIKTNTENIRNLIHQYINSNREFFESEYNQFLCR